MGSARVKTSSVSAGAGFFPSTVWKSLVFLFFGLPNACRTLMLASSPIHAQAHPHRRTHARAARGRLQYFGERLRRMHVCLYVCLSVCPYVCKYVCMYVFMYVWIFVLTHVCIQIYWYSHVCISHTYIYIYVFYGLFTASGENQSTVSAAIWQFLAILFFCQSWLLQNPLCFQRQPGTRPCERHASTWLDKAVQPWDATSQAMVWQWWFLHRNSREIRQRQIGYYPPFGQASATPSAGATCCVDQR